MDFFKRLTSRYIWFSRLFFESRGADVIKDAYFIFWFSRVTDGAAMPN
jgi:hypothetical protein